MVQIGSGQGKTGQTRRALEAGADIATGGRLSVLRWRLELSVVAR